MSTRNPPRPLRPRLVTVTLVPARMRSAYVETRCLMQRADGATAEERAPYFADHTIEVSFAEEAAGRTSDGAYLVRRDDAGITITVGAVERSGGVWFYRSARDVRKPVQAGELMCDGAQRADRVRCARTGGRWRSPSRSGSRWQLPSRTSTPPCARTSWRRSATP